LNSKIQEGVQVTRWLSERVSELQIELELAEEAVKAYAASTDLISAEALETMNRRRKTMRERIAQLSISSADAAQLPALVKAEASLQEKFDKQSGELVRLAQLRREAAASQLIYETLLSRFKETAIQQGTHTADAQFLTPAPLKDTPTFPKRGLVLTLGSFLGLVAGVFAVLIAEARNLKIRNLQHLGSVTGLPIGCEIPVFRERRRRNFLNWLKENPASPAVESMRNLRASIFAASHPQVIAVTSPNQREGKTETALALAIAINATGKSVLVIDGDFRNRDFDAYFDMDRASGLQQIISGTAKFSNCILELEETGLHILPAGSTENEDNASDLLFTRTWQRLWPLRNPSMIASSLTRHHFFNFRMRYCG
jgi:succinoglycan biosynthesis transport protein ExoP